MPSVTICALVSFLVWVNAWEWLVSPPAEGRPFTILICGAFWGGLASAPGYIRGARLVATNRAANAAERAWVLSSVSAALLVCLVGGIMTLTTIVFGFLGLASAGSATRLLVDLLRAQRSASG